MDSLCFASLACTADVLRGCAWLLSLLPSVTLLMLLRLSLLPLGLHRVLQGFAAVALGFLGDVAALGARFGSTALGFALHGDGGCARAVVRRGRVLVATDRWLE